MMNNKKAEESNLMIKLSNSSIPKLENKYIVKHFVYKIPLLFNLYENRLIHNEFLEYIFLDILESNELLAYNFQNKIFSFYNGTKNISILKILYSYEAKVFVIVTIVILLLSSFRFKRNVIKIKNFFSLYFKNISKITKYPFLRSILLLSKILKFIKQYIYLIYKNFQRSFMTLYQTLVLNYLSIGSYVFNKEISKEKYELLFSSFEYRELKMFYNKFLIFWLSTIFKEYFLINLIFKQDNQVFQDSTDQVVIN